MKHQGYAIPYRPELRAVCGSVTATILFQQLEYWFENQGGEFYKFLSPCPGHKNYKEGDSWQEELGFSGDEFRAAFDRIGKRYRSKKEFNDDQDDRVKFMFVSYTDKRSGLTHYVRNAGAINTTLANQVYSKSDYPSYSKQTSPIPWDGKIQDREIDNSYTGRLENPIPKIVTEITPETTRENTHTEREPEPPDLRKLDEPLKLYAEHCFQFDRIGNDPALIAACHRIGVDAVGDALKQCAQEAQKTGHQKRHTPTLSKLLHDTDNMLKRAAMYEPGTQAQWWSGLSETAIIDRIVSLLRYRIEIPQEVGQWIPQAQQILNARLAV